MSESTQSWWVSALLKGNRDKKKRNLSFYFTILRPRTDVTFHLPTLIVKTHLIKHLVVSWSSQWPVALSSLHDISFSTRLLLDHVQLWNPITSQIYCPLFPQIQHFTTHTHLDPRYLFHISFVWPNFDVDRWLWSHFYWQRSLSIWNHTQLS